MCLKKKKITTNDWNPPQQEPDFKSCALRGSRSYLCEEREDKHLCHKDLMVCKGHSMRKAQEGGRQVRLQDILLIGFGKQPLQAATTEDYQVYF